MKLVNALVLAALTVPSLVVAQSDKKPAEIRFRALNCKNGRPVKGKKVGISVYDPKTPSLYEDTEGRTDAKGVVMFRLQREMPPQVAAMLSDSDWGFSVRDSTQNVLATGVLQD